MLAASSPFAETPVLAGLAAPFSAVADSAPFAGGEAHIEYYNPGRPIGGRACPRTVELDADTIGVVFYDVDAARLEDSGLFFLRIPRGLLIDAAQ
jgi:hypothetical protein